MPLSHETKAFAVSDCKIAKLLTDPAGGSATYGTLTDVPGIKEVTVSGEVNSVSLRGDNTELDRNTSITGRTLTVSHAKVSLDVLAILLGTATTADTGVTPNQVATLTMSNTDTPNYFRLVAKTPTGGADSPTGDVHYSFDKCIITSFPDLGLAEEDYRIVSFEAAAIPLVSTGRAMRIIANETAAVLA